MEVFGFTINLLTAARDRALSRLGGWTDAIVVVENVERHLREGRTPIDAALIGARELVGPVIAMTITLAAVYAPIGLQGGLTGTLFREFALTLAGFGHHFRHRCTHAFTDDGVAAPAQRGPTKRRVSPGG